MPLFTKFFKLKSVSENRFGKYMLYALGEVILVVVGILIALQINNYNEENKQQKLLNGILKSVSYDLAQDTVRMAAAIRYYEAKDELTTKIMNDEYQRADFASCAVCGVLISTYFPVSINDKGYHQLKNYNETSKSRDSLVVDVVQFYGALRPLLDEFGAQVKDYTLENIENWRDSQPWFSEIISGRVDERFIDYMTTLDFKNRAAYYNVIACKNYLLYLKLYKKNAEEVLGLLEARLAASD